MSNFSDLVNMLWANGVKKRDCELVALRMLEIVGFEGLRLQNAELERMNKVLIDFFEAIENSDDLEMSACVYDKFVNVRNMLKEGE